MTSPTTTTRTPRLRDSVAAARKAAGPSKSQQAREAREAKVTAAALGQVAENERAAKGRKVANAVKAAVDPANVVEPGDGPPAPESTGITKADVKASLAAAREAGKATKARKVRPLKALDPQPLTFDAAERYPDIAPTHVPLIEAAYATLDRDAVQAALANAYVAGLPITIMGRLIGRSAGEARRMALHGAKTLGIEVTLRGRGNATPRAGGGSGSSAATVTYDPQVRYPGWSEVAEALDRPAAKVPDVRAAIVLQAMTDGFPITLIGSHLGWSASRVHTTAKAYATKTGREFPSKEARKALRAKGTKPITAKGKAAAKDVAAAAKIDATTKAAPAAKTTTTKAAPRKAAK